MAKAIACLRGVAGSERGARKLQHFLQHHSMRICKVLEINHEFQTTGSIHHGRAR